MLEIKNVKKAFGETDVLKDINIKVNTGEVVAILGPSGSGKTTLLRLISFLEKSDQGEITVDEFHYDMTEISKKQIQNLRMHMGFVFQSYNVFNNMTALQNVKEGLVTARKISRVEAEKIATEVLDKVGLFDRKDFYPSELSGGQQQRVAIARAIATNPRILMFDEPTSALDPQLTADVLEVIKRLASEGTTMLIVTHEMGFACNVADRIIFMDAGEVVEDLPANEFFNSKNPRTKRFLNNTK